ncbi:hypothetical protein PGTUg99_012071 [Puccinia graminis f. sp. tritici]|uniref:Uncharacterized protein n=1 Tax=Puccinia graminis f. sp. tritici TaxID=56615 RepID=A0A5B0RB62_PUCGR|nr:hypothetical protein PGTUg99_012071 [Puccinia graminis f. sp. tritici]
MFNFKASLVTAHEPTQHCTKGVQRFCYDHNETPYKCDHCNSGADQDPHGSPFSTLEWQHCNRMPSRNIGGLGGAPDVTVVQTTYYIPRGQLHPSGWWARSKHERGS